MHKQNNKYSRPRAIFGAYAPPLVTTSTLHTPG